MGIHFSENIVNIHDRIKWLVDNLAEGKNTIFADKLGINEANVRSYIKGVQPKADILSKIVLSYEVNALWLLTGAGYPLQKNEQPEVPPNTLTADATIKDFFDQSDPYLQKKDAKIIQQAEEIGQLKEQVRQLTIETERLASNARLPDTANAG